MEENDQHDRSHRAPDERQGLRFLHREGLYSGRARQLPLTEMSAMSYIEIPRTATRILVQHTSITSAPQTSTSLPLPSSPLSQSSPRPPRSAAHFSQFIRTHLPTASLHPASLLSGEPLSFNIATANFRRFVANAGPIFWFQDRVEEILLWKKGWKRTTVWMAIYAFFCCYPRMILVLPNIALIAIILARQQRHNISTLSEPWSPTEGSADWLANMQAIQNLMGALMDVRDAFMPVVPHITLSPSSRTAPLLLIVSLISSLPLLFLMVLPSFPVRTLLLLLGIGPILAAHPSMRRLAQAHMHPHLQRVQRRLRMRVARWADDDRLPDDCWSAPMREVELWENERFDPSTGAWGKDALRSDERASWTRAMDGWTDLKGGDGSVSTLTFALPPRWEFVSTEDWRPDLCAEWAGNIGGDDDGWVYTNDIWLHPHPVPTQQTGFTASVTRRRRWIRRVWLRPEGES